MIVCIAGLGASVYLTIVHYNTALTISCPLTSAAINCEKVTTSPQSYIFHVPVAVLGLAYFVPMLVLSLPLMWRSANRLVAYARLALSLSGIGFVIYLVHAELFEIRAICLWCTSVHILTFIIFIIVVTGWNDATAFWVVADGPVVDEAFRFERSRLDHWHVRIGGTEVVDDVWVTGKGVANHLVAWLRCQERLWPSPLRVRGRSSTRTSSSTSGSDTACSAKSTAKANRRHK